MSTSARTRAIHAKRGSPLERAAKLASQTDREMNVGAAGAGGVGSIVCARAADGRLMAASRVRQANGTRMSRSGHCISAPGWRGRDTALTDLFKQLFNSLV